MLKKRVSQHEECHDISYTIIYIQYPLAPLHVRIETNRLTERLMTD